MVRSVHAGYLRDGEAQSGHFGLCHQGDFDAVGQNHLAADDVLNDAMGQTTETQ